MQGIHPGPNLEYMKRSGWVEKMDCMGGPMYCGAGGASPTGVF